MADLLRLAEHGGAPGQRAAWASDSDIVTTGGAIEDTTWEAAAGHSRQGFAIETYRRAG